MRSSRRHGYSWLWALVSLLLAVLAVWLAVRGAEFLFSMRWLGPESPASPGPEPDFFVRVAFCAALLSAQVAQWLRRGAAPEPLVVALLCALGTWLYFHAAVVALLFALGGGGRTGLYALVGLLLVLFSLGLLILRTLPLRRPGRVEALAKFAGGLAVLLILMAPWHYLQLIWMSPEERNEAALVRFGATLDVARETAWRCLEEHDSIGLLQRLDVSGRRNSVFIEPGQMRVFFDFDYVGTKGAGRVSLGFVQRVSGRNRMLVDPSEGGKAHLRVYGDGVSKAVVLVCPFVSQVRGAP